jgi:hypothetical protein
VRVESQPDAMKEKANVNAKKWGGVWEELCEVLECRVMGAD